MPPTYSEKYTTRNTSHVNKYAGSPESTFGRAMFGRSKFGKARPTYTAKYTVRGTIFVNKY